MSMNDGWDPADDRDEPTDEEIDEAVACSDTHDLAIDLLAADDDDRTILAIVRQFRDKLFESINLNRENQKSDGDE